MSATSSPTKHRRRWTSPTMPATFLCFAAVSALFATIGDCTPDRVFTNEWAVNIVGGAEVADRLAAKHGFINMGQIMPEYYLFMSPRVRKGSTRQTLIPRLNLAGEPEVRWLDQQVARRRVKRDLLDMTAVSPNDDLWKDMWYLNRGIGLDHNVRQAWDLGVTGKDVVVTILDDGLEYVHPDIQQNYDPLASFDLNSHDSDPTPRYDVTNENKHGTRCAGEVAAVFNNSFCIVGVAFNARIGGIRMLDGEVTDAVEAASLSHNRDHIDIYSASWGPDDDGRTVDGPARLAQIAFQEGIRKGRGGKGSLFVWASGNGGRDADSCNCDGYTNSIYTLSISSATENGNVPWYSEPCSSTLATTYSSGSHGERMIVTTDLHKQCTTGHTGTSASAPIAAGICALALEANPSLTWRDLKHIVVRTARSDHLRSSDWVTNGIGRNVSHSFGYGLMDAGAMVLMARNWTTVPPQRQCNVEYDERYRLIPPRTTLQVTLTTNACGGTENAVNFLEHVQARITLAAPKRGDIQIYLTSPSGTKSTLLTKRPRDTSKAGFRDWAFMTTHVWGESSSGVWKLEVQNDGWSDASLLRWDLILYGTMEQVGPQGGASGSHNVSRLGSGGHGCRATNALSLCIGLWAAAAAVWRRL